MNNIKFIETKTLKPKPNDDDLTFGTIFTDYMFTMDYDRENGWHDAKIEPYAPIEMMPSSMVFHYGQAIFEGLKAYRSDSGDILTFRAIDNMRRLNVSAERMCIPEFDLDVAMNGLSQLLETEKGWVPSKKGTSLYIRPFIIATDPFVGVRPSNTYKFMIILSPVGAYYSTGLKPIDIYVSEYYVRAVKGGVGFTKTAGNYAASLYAADKAKKEGYGQVLWLDAVEKKYVDEVGTMNIFFKIDGKLITPSLEGGSILAGITRDSVIKLANDMNIPVEERNIEIAEVFAAAKNGTLEDVFGTGTAAVISPVGSLTYKGDKIVVNNGETGEFSGKLYDTITGLQYGINKEKYGWVKKAF